MGWWGRKGVSEEAKKTLLEAIKKEEEVAFQRCVKLTEVGIVIGQLEQTKKDMIQSLYQGAIDAGADEEEALKAALEKWEKILAQAREHLKAKGPDVR